MATADGAALGERRLEMLGNFKEGPGAQWWTP